MPHDRAVTLVDEVEAAVKVRREAELRCARALAELGDHKAWEQFNCASVSELGERIGLAGAEARALLDLGRAIRTSPLLEQKVTQGKVTVAAACCIAAALSDPKLLRDEDDWIGWAEAEPMGKVRDRVRRRREEVRIGDEPVCPVSLFVRQKGRDDFQRARTVASRKAGRALTPGETFEIVVDHYLDTFDVDRVTAGERRCPPTAQVNGRYVPMAVRREIFERQGHNCAVPFCMHTMFLEMAHLWAHASGGDREADNLILLCSTHHFFLDYGSITLVGTAAKPQFFSDGEDMAKRYEPGGSMSGSRSRKSQSGEAGSGPPGSDADPGGKSAAVLPPVDLPPADRPPAPRTPEAATSPTPPFDPDRYWNGRRPEFGT